MVGPGALAGRQLVDGAADPVHRLPDARLAAPVAIGVVGGDSYVAVWRLKARMAPSLKAALRRERAGGVLGRVVALLRALLQSLDGLSLALELRRGVHGRVAWAPTEVG